MGAMASQITSLTIVYLTVFSGAHQRKHQSSASLAFVRGIHRWPVNSPHKWPVTRKMFPLDDVIMTHISIKQYIHAGLIWFALIWYHGIHSVIFSRPVYSSALYAHEVFVAWKRHQMETFSAQLALCEENSPVTGEFASQRASNADFVVSLTWLLNKQSNDRRFATTRLSYTYNELMKCLWHDDVIKWKHFRVTGPVCGILD